MAKIELSAGWVKTMVPKLVGLGQGSTNSGDPASLTGILNSPGNYTVGCSYGYLYLMKGVMPTSFLSIATLSTRISDVLWVASTGYTSYNDFVGSQTNINPVTISTIYKSAIAAGDATWFWLVSVPVLTGGSASITPSPNLTVPLTHSAYGSVGLLGSGSDLEMPNTVIVSGEQYRVRNLRLQFPDSWTY